MSELESIQKIMVDLLAPLARQGVSVRPLPNDLKIGVARSAMVYPFIAGYKDDTATETDSPIKTQITGVRRYQAYVIILGFELSRAQGTLTLCEEVVKLLSNQVIKLGGVELDFLVKSAEFTSAADGLWQYRVPVEISRPLAYRSQPNLIIK